jgi:Variant SH3 domain
MARKKVRVGRAFPAGFFDGLTQPPLIVRKGDVLTVEDDLSEEWPAFVPVTNKAGERGWVPERYLRRRGRRAITTQDYDTTTLNPATGDVLTVLEEDTESGWVWCRSGEGKVGWFAIDHLATVG